MNTTDIILICTNAPILLVALYAGYYFSTFGKELRVFSGFLFLSVLIQFPSSILSFFYTNNMPLLHLYTLLGGLILILFYRTLLQNYLPDKTLKYGAGLYVLFILIDSLFIENVFTFNTIGLTVEAVIIVILALSSFLILMNEHTAFNNKKLLKGITWINSGLFIYFTSNLLLYYFGDYLVHQSVSISSFKIIWMLHSLFLITMYLFFFVGLWKASKN